MKDSVIAAVDLPEPYLSGDYITGFKATHSVTLQYQNLSPPQNTSSVILSQGDHSPINPSYSSGSETSGTNTSSPHRGRKKILTAQVLKSRDSSPSEAAKLPPLTKPKLFTPPQHRRLCKTGTGGLLDRPTTPDPFFDDSDDSLSGSLTDMTCLSLPTSLSSFATVPRITTKTVEISSHSGRLSPVDITISDQIYSSSHSIQSTNSQSVEKNTNNNSSGDESKGILHAFSATTLSVPLPRMGRRMTYDISFVHTQPDVQSPGSRDDQIAHSSSQHLTVDTRVQSRRLSTGAVCVQEGIHVGTSPLLGHKVVLKDNARQPKYV